MAGNKFSTGLASQFRKSLPVKAMRPKNGVIKAKSRCATQTKFAQSCWSATSAPVSAPSTASFERKRTQAACSLCCTPNMSLCHVQWWLSQLQQFLQVPMWRCGTPPSLRVHLRGLFSHTDLEVPLVDSLEGCTAVSFSFSVCFLVSFSVFYDRS